MKPRINPTIHLKRFREAKPRMNQMIHAERFREAKPNERLQRVIALLNRSDVDYLDNMGKDSLFTKGTKLSRVKIIRAMIEAMRRLEITGRGIGSEEELKEEILKKVSSLAAPAVRDMLDKESKR